MPKFNNNNEEVTLLPKSLFVNLINTLLNNKIAKSLEKDPFVLKILHSVQIVTLGQDLWGRNTFLPKVNLCSWQRQLKKTIGPKIPWS